MRIELKNKLNSLLRMPKEQQMQEVLADLVANGFEKVGMRSKRYIVTAFTKPDCPYVVIELKSKKDSQRDTLCVLDKVDYEKMKDMYFRNNLRGKKGCKRYPRIQVTGNYEGKHLSGANVSEMVCAKTKGQVIDHKFHNTMINTREALRACTVKENNMNKKKCKHPTNPEYAYKPEEDFGKTWFLYIYGRVLGEISMEEAFAFNLDHNDDN